MQLKYSELETHDKAVVVQRLAKRFASRQIHVDEWLQQYDCYVDQITLQLHDRAICELENYLQALE